MAHYILNSAASRDRTAELLLAGRWEVAAEEPHRDALAAGDLALVYVAAPARVFVGRAELAGTVPGGVALGAVEVWDAPVRMDVVLLRLDPSAKAKADFDLGVVRITEHEYDTVLAVAAEQQP